MMYYQVFSVRIMDSLNVINILVCNIITEKGKNLKTDIISGVASIGGSLLVILVCVTTVAIIVKRRQG